MDKYKELDTRISLMNSREWVHSINMLKTLEIEIDNENKDYTVIYKKENQRKNREFRFNKVEYVEENNSFIFISFQTDDEDEKLTDEIDSREVLMDIEIIDLTVEDKQDYSSGCYT